jgi:hypothetical protein
MFLASNYLREINNILLKETLNNNLQIMDNIGQYFLVLLQLARDIFS